MNSHTFRHLRQSALYAFTASVTIVALLFTVFFFAEPAITHGQADTATFTVSQQITDATSFLVAPVDVTTSGSIDGVTGGNASGTTDFVVQSNNATGYFVNIDFFDNGTAETMLGDITASESIRDYGPAGGLGEPDYGYTASTAAQFAYTVTSLTGSDTDQSFLNNGAACNAGASQNGATPATKCWMEPDVTNFRIVDRGNSALTGATSTIEFDITVPSAPVPALSAEGYTATVTLSLFTQ